MIAVVLFIAGLTGMSIQVICFALLETHRIKENNFWFHFCNFFGSMLLITYGVYEQVWPFVALDVIWGYYSFRNIPADIRKMHLRVWKSLQA